VGNALRYVTGEEPGISRRRAGRGFVYRDASGARITDRRELARLRALAIPPAWTEVWICAREDGHLQAHGRDARGRKQYRYHAEFRRLRDQDKFDRLEALGAALPALRRRVDEELARPGLDESKVLALAVALLDRTGARIGNEEYRRANGSFGLTTLRSSHASAEGTELRLEFPGKAGVLQSYAIDDPRVARAVRRCQELPGQPLFQYRDARGAPQPIDSTSVNRWLREATGAEVSAKDLRTWYGSVAALERLAACAKRRPGPPGDRALVEPLAEVARQLGNTRAACRKHYVHPLLVESFLAGSLAVRLAELPKRRRRGLSVWENRLLELIASTRVPLPEGRSARLAPARRGSSRRRRPSAAGDRAADGGRERAAGA
jgi:DNA topoisomerase-1